MNTLRIRERPFGLYLDDKLIEDVLSFETSRAASVDRPGCARLTLTLRVRCGPNLPDFEQPMAVSDGTAN